MISNDDFENLATILRRDSLKAHLKQGGFYKEDKHFKSYLSFLRAERTKPPAGSPPSLLTVWPEFHTSGGTYLFFRDLVVDQK